MRRLLTVLALAAGTAVVAASPAAAGSPWTPGTCTAALDAGGHLSVTGTMPEGSYTYGWGIYDPVPGGYSPETGSGTLTTAADGTFTFTSPQTAAWYLAQVPGETALEFYVEHGEIHAHQYDQEIVIAACSYPG